MVVQGSHSSLILSSVLHTIGCSSPEAVSLALNESAGCYEKWRVTRELDLGECTKVGAEKDDIEEVAEVDEVEPRCCDRLKGHTYKGMKTL